MEKAPAFQLYPADFLADANVVLMSNREVGCYIKLLCFCWREGSIPKETEKLARLCGEDPGVMQNEIWPNLAPCFKENGNRFVHPRLDKERKKQAEWRKKSSNGGVRSSRMRAARKKGTHTEEEWLSLLAAASGVCPRCNKPTDNFDKDHVVPVYQGGSDSIDNIQPLCAKCNSQKGPETIDYFIEQRVNALRVVQPKGKHTVQPKGKHTVQPKGNTSSSSSSSPSSSYKEEYIYTSKKGRKLKGESLKYFDLFWDAFAYKAGKAEAADSWYDLKIHSTELYKQIIAGAEKEARRRPELIEAGKTPKMAQGWLSGRRWEDEDLSDGFLKSLSEIKERKLKEEGK